MVDLGFEAQVSILATAFIWQLPWIRPIPDSKFRVSFDRDFRRPSNSPIYSYRKAQGSRALSARPQWGRELLNSWGREPDSHRPDSVTSCYTIVLTPVNCVEDNWGWWLHATSASGRRALATEHIWMPKSSLVRRWVSPGSGCVLELLDCVLLIARRVLYVGSCTRSSVGEHLRCVASPQPPEYRRHAPTPPTGAASEGGR
jgi:hypothetical protein